MQCGDEDFLVTMRDVRAAEGCSKGCRKFAERYNLDWQEFLNKGILASRLIATGDAMALNIVEVAKNGRK